MTPPTMAPIFCRAALCFRTANITSPAATACASIRDQVSGPRSRHLKLAGFADSDARAARIVELEHSIAEKHTSLADNEDVHKADNTWKQADFAVKAPGLDWAEFFRAAGLGRQMSFTVWQPEAFTAESALVASEPLDTWKDWLAYHLIEKVRRRAAQGLCRRALRLLRRDAFRYAEAASALAAGSHGRQRLARRRGRAESMPNVISHPRPRRAPKPWSPTSSSLSASGLTHWTGWLPATKAEAQAKLNTLYVGVGYPETWRDYSALEIKPDDIIGNLWRGSRFEYTRNLTRLGNAGR